MAGANAKRIAATNAKTIQQLRIGFAVSFSISLLALLVFSSLRNFSHLFRLSTTSVIAGALWKQLEGISVKGDELSAAGLTSYMFDIVYVTWLTHAAVAVISTRFWVVYLIIPLYALYRAGAFVLPYVWPASAGGSVPATPVGVKRKTGPIPVAPVAAEEISKRQAKMKKRSEKGGVRVSY